MKKIVILSEGDSAGSGSRISNAINKHCKELTSVCIVNRSKRKIGHFNADYIIGQNDKGLEDIQKIIDDADIIHFKDDEPLSRNWNGLLIPQQTPIVHTAGGSSFRGHDFEINDDEIIQSKDVNFGPKWKTQKRLNGRYIYVFGNSIQIDGSAFDSDSHNNIWSNKIEVPKNSNSICIKGKHRLIKNMDNKKYDIRSIIIRFYNKEGRIIETKKKNTGSLLGRETKFNSIFPLPEGVNSIRYSFFTHKIYKIDYSLKDCKIEFYKLKEEKLTSLISQFSVANSTWDLAAYDIASIKTVLTPDLLYRESDRRISPHVQPKINLKGGRKNVANQIVITHAPSNAGKKGTSEFIIPAIKKLSKSYNIKFNLIQNLSHEDCLNEIVKSDIFIDQMVAGYYGNAGLEAMTMGIPVLAYISENTINLAGGDWKDIPILRVKNLSVDSVIKTLKPVLDDKKQLKLAGRRSKQWAKNIHSEKKIAEMWEGVYGELENQIPIKTSEDDDLEIENNYDEIFFKGGGSWGDVSPDKNDKKIDISIKIIHDDKKIDMIFDKSLEELQNIEIKIFKIGWYGGKGARLVNNISIKFDSYNKDYKNQESFTNECEIDYKWPHGCYRIVFDNIYFGRVTRHFILKDKSNTHTNLLIYPQITSSLRMKKNRRNFEAIYSNGKTTKEIDGINITDNEGNLDGDKISNWLFPTIMWLEKNKVPFKLIKDIDITINDLELEKIKSIIFTGDNYIWTNGVNNLVKEHVSKNNGDIIILGTGIGEEIAYISKNKHIAVLPYIENDESHRKNWDKMDLPISIGAEIPKNRFFTENVDKNNTDDDVNSIHVNSIIGKYKYNMNFTETIFSLDGEEFGEISSKIFHLKNGSKIFNAGILEFPRMLLDADNKNQNDVISKASDTLKSMLWSDGKNYSNEQLMHHNFKRNWEFSDISNSSNKIPKICLVMPIWKRPKLTEKVMQHYMKIKDELKGKIDLINIVIGSEGEKTKKKKKKYNFKYIEHVNSPLSKKWDSGIKTCRNYNPDGVLIVGSDDIISSDLVISLLGKLKQGRLIVGILDLYIFDSMKNNLMYWPGYDKNSHRFGETIGLCRLISKDLLEKMDYEIWGNLEIDKGLDLAMTNKFILQGLFPMHYSKEKYINLGDKEISLAHSGFYLKEVEGHAVDIKTNFNITPTESYDMLIKNENLPEFMEKIRAMVE